MKNNKFSNSYNYIVESIPENLNFFSKKKWLNDKIAENESDKTLVYIKKNKVLLAFIEEEASFWMPLEKTKFFLNIAKSDEKSNVGNFLIIEKNKDDFYFYAVENYLNEDVFLIYYGKNKYQAMNSFSSDFKILCFGNFDLSELEIDSQKAEYLNYSFVYNSLNEYNSEISYLNEDNMNLNENFDDLFFKWIEKEEVAENKKPTYYKKSYFAFFVIIFGCCFYLRMQINYINQEINNLSSRITNLNFQNKN